MQQQPLKLASTPKTHKLARHTRAAGVTCGLFGRAGEEGQSRCEGMEVQVVRPGKVGRWRTAGRLAAGRGGREGGRKGGRPRRRGGGGCLV